VEDKYIDTTVKLKINTLKNNNNNNKKQKQRIQIPQGYIITFFHPTQNCTFFKMFSSNIHPRISGIQNVFFNTNIMVHQNVKYCTKVVFLLKH